MRLVLFLHLAAAIFWMGGMAFVVLALRPVLHEQLEPPARLRLIAAVLSRFFVVVAISIAVLLATGGALLGQAAQAPPGWHAMAALGVLMALIFGHIAFVPFRRLRKAVAEGDWPQGGRCAQLIALLVKINLGIGWIAIAAVIFWR